MGGGGGGTTDQSWASQVAKLDQWDGEEFASIPLPPHQQSLDLACNFCQLESRGGGGGGMISSLYLSITISLSPPLSSLSYDLFSISFSLHILLSLFARLLTSTLYLKSPARGYRVRILVRNWDKCLESFPPCYSLSHPQSTYINRYEIGWVYLPTQLEGTLQLCTWL